MKKKSKKLTLSVETLRHLEEEKLDKAAGAGPCYLSINSCPTHTCASNCGLICA